MTNKQINRLIAEECGWDRFCMHEVDGKLVNYGYPKGSRLKYEMPLYDYSNDLNAMHEAEDVLSAEQWNDYIEYLSQQVHSMFRMEHLVSATAAQKAKAFLRARGRWEGESK